MKRYLIVVILFLVVSTVKGAYFEYYAGGFRAFYEVEAEDSGSTDGPYSKTVDDPNFASVEEYAWVDSGWSYSYNHIWGHLENDSLCIQAQSITDANAENTFCQISGYGFGSTEDSETYGIFYQIMPDGDEEMGDDVIVYYSDTVSISASGYIYAYVGGPADIMDHMAITLNQLPPVLTAPDPNNEVLTFPNLAVEVENDAGDWFSGVLSFPAKIGDVVGIFAENYTHVTNSAYVTGPFDELVESRLTIVLTVKLLGDLDGDGDVDFSDFAIFANNWLAGVP